MAGNVHGHVDCLITCPATVSGSVQEMFTNIFQHYMNMCSSSYAQLISLYTGSAATGTPVNSGGTNYHNQPNPFGENAWACFKIPSGTTPDTAVSSRAVDYYLLISWCYNLNPNVGKGSPMVFNSTTNVGIGYAIAWRDDGRSPWNGTTYSTQSVVSAGYGNDNLGSAIWTAGTSSLHVFPRSNNFGGSHVTLKNNLSLLFDNPSFSAAQTTRHHIVSDRDSTAVFSDYLDNGSYDQIVVFGTYDPIPGLAGAGLIPMPMCAYSTHTLAYFQINTSYGDTAGSATAQGGIVGPRMSPGYTVRSMRNERFVNCVFVASTPLEPNPQFPSASFDSFKIPVIMYEDRDFGFLGYVNFVTETFNCNSNSINSGSTFAVFGPAPNVNQPQTIVPWSGVSPGISVSRTGSIF